ncbi:MAG: hypothetical protein U5J98_10895 [Halobacteriales archaeon]|nr:hypothetical protein [Halobacteriales archaeon]
MRLFEYVADRDWPPVFGYGLFVALMTAGYYYNITVVQLGLIDLGGRVVGLSDAAVSGWMAALALLAVGAAVATGLAT